jgi:hypothetical protein
LVVAGLAALVFSSLLELAHWFEYSQQADVAGIAAGVIGAVLGNRSAVWLGLRQRAVVRAIRPAALLAMPLYLALLPLLWGWKLGYIGSARIMQTTASIRWMPFYYHYYTSEANAVASVVLVFFCFLPLGAFAWALKLRVSDLADGSTFLPLEGNVSPAVALAAILLSLVLEVGALLTAGHRPDPTNILIAICAAILGQRACEWIARVLNETSSPVEASP